MNYNKNNNSKCIESSSKTIKVSEGKRERGKRQTDQDHALYVTQS